MKEIEGVPVLGFRTTYREPISDGDAKGETGIYEVWVSDELAATIVEMRSTLDGKILSRRTLKSINREQPDASLFQIPEGYTVNPSPGEIPYQDLSGLRKPANP